MANFRFTGLREMEANFRALRDAPALYKRVASSMNLIGELIMTDSKKTTPVDWGALRDSGVVLPPIISKRNIRVELGFGGVTSSKTKDGKNIVGYAIPVHENLQVGHTVGTAKYLERPFNQWRGRFMQMIGKEIRAGMQRVSRVQRGR